MELIKFFLLTFFIAGYASAIEFKHSQDNYSIALIPEGAYIEFIKDFNINAKKFVHRITPKSLYYDHKKNRCSLYLPNDDASSKKNRVIRKGTKFNVYFGGMRFPRLNFVNKKINTLACYVPKKHNANMTIKELRRAISKYAKLHFPETDEF